VDHKNVKVFNPTDCWTPLFPYEPHLSFNGLDQEQVQLIRDIEFDGLDPNLVSLYVDYPEICTPYFERLAYDDEYRKILEEFKGNSAPIILSDSDIEYVTNVLESRRNEFKKVLKF
jgi:hypothetical protein